MSSIDRLQRRRLAAWERFNRLRRRAARFVATMAAELELERAWDWIMAWDGAYHKAMTTPAPLTETERELDRR